MRLICPNCGAQYEVPPEAVPPAGRDVQCSACQHVWFEKGPPPKLLNPLPWEQVPRVEDDEEEADDLADLRSAPPPQAPPRPRVDPEVSRILREEAQREAQARAEEAGRRAFPESTDDSAPDLPDQAQLHDDPVTRAVADLARADAAHRAAAPVAVARPAPAKAQAQSATAPRPRRIEEPAPPPPSPAPTPSSRPADTVSRDVDIHRINSTLRSQADRLGSKAPQLEAPRRRGGFGWGFSGTLLVMALLAALYVLRPEIVEAVPQAAVVLDPYAQAVDAGRLWLDRQVGNALGARTTNSPAE